MTSLLRAEDSTETLEAGVALADRVIRERAKMEWCTPRAHGHGKEATS